MKIVDIHTHGGFGINFNTSTLTEVENFAVRALKHCIKGFCPTLATDSLENIQRQLEIFDTFKKSQSKGAVMLGVHLEAAFLNPKKAGIHDPKHFLSPTVENFKKLTGNFQKVVKIVTMAPELDENLQLSEYLNSSNIKVQAGHTLIHTASGVNATTHHFNAMPALSHHSPTITLDALLDDKIYCEVIADGIHVSDEMLKLFFKVKNPDKTILISDSLPIAHSTLHEITFCSEKITTDGKNSAGTLAGSVLFLKDIVNRLDEKKILPKDIAQKMVWDNPIAYLGLEQSEIEKMEELI